MLLTPRVASVFIYYAPEAMARPLLTLLMALLACASTQLVIQYDTGPDGTTSVFTYMRLINLTDQGVQVKEDAVHNAFPPFIRVEYSVSYSGNVEGDVLYGDAVDVTIRAYNLLPTPVPLLVSVAAGEGIGVSFSKPPSMVATVGGTTTYYWSTLLANYTELRLRVVVKDFGSFGAARLPLISTSSTVDFQALMEADEERARQIRDGLTKLAPLLSAMDNFTSSITAQLQSLAQLVQLLNTTGAAFKQGSRALNTSSLLVEALNGQLRALAEAASVAAEAVNRSRLLVDYQYAALMAAANALEVQAAALKGYSDSADRYSQSVEQAMSSLTSTRAGVVRISADLLQVIRRLTEARNALASIKTNITAVNEAISRAVGALDSALSLLSTARDSVDAVIYSLDGLIATLGNVKRTLQETRDSLSQLIPLLEQTAMATRTNATEIRRNMPTMLTNVAVQLETIASNLHMAASQVSGYTAPIRQAATTLLRIGNELASSAGELAKYRAERLALLPQIGYFKSLLLNYSDALRRQLEELEAQDRTLASFVSLYKAPEVQVIYIRRLPVAISPTFRQINVTRPIEAEVKGSVPMPATIMAAVTAAAMVAALLAAKKRLTSSSSL